MKTLNSAVALFLVLLSALHSNAQVTCSANASDGSGYSAVLASGLEIENPDCRHNDFGAHITMSYDDLLERNVFLFHSHIVEDTDRCQVEDRIRMEIKGASNSDSELQHPLGSTSYYRWKFKVPSDFMGTSSFCHIFQDKIKGGNDDSFPVLTFTLRSSILEVIHNGGDTGTDLGRLSSVSLDAVKGKWLEAYVASTHAENGSLHVTLKDIATQEIILSYENTDIDLWRDGADFSRPKFGIYRSRNTILKDEIIQFADFCISETSEDLCPADTFIIADLVAPSTPEDLTASNIMINSVDLSWSPSSDNVGVTAYILFQDGMEVYQGIDPSATISTVGSTTYSFTVAATDAGGNISDQSAPIEVTTTDANTLPSAATNPSPSDTSEGLQLPVFLNWEPGDNSDSYVIYLGTTTEPDQVNTQSSIGYTAEMLEAETTYYWRIGSINANGETLSNLWSFTTGAPNSDFPWKVYRANERMHVETEFMKEQDRPEFPDIDEIFADPQFPDNSLYSYYEEGEEKFRWRNSFSETDTAFTVVSRFKALNDDVNCVCYFEVRGFGFREKVRVNQSTIKLERSSPVIEKDLPFDILADFHTLRMTMSGNSAKIYLDENPVPFAIGNSTTNDSNFNFEWGKSGSNACGGTIDWLTVINNQAIPPGTNLLLPQDLISLSDPVSNNEESLLGLSIYPNPTTDQIIIKWDDTKSGTVKVVDKRGVCLYARRFMSGQSLDMGDYPAGIYYITVERNNKNVTTKKIIKTK